MAQKTKHLEISRQLRAAIAVGRYGAKGRLPGEPQLVKQFGVSRPTIARAMLDLQAEGLIERRAGSGTYVRSSAAGRPAAARVLGLLVPGLGTTEIFEVICGELAGLAHVHDYSLLRGGSTRPPRIWMPVWDTRRKSAEGSLKAKSVAFSSRHTS